MRRSSKYWPTPNSSATPHSQTSVFFHSKNLSRSIKKGNVLHHHPVKIIRVQEIPPQKKIGPSPPGKLTNVALEKHLFFVINTINFGGCPMKNVGFREGSLDFLNLNLSCMVWGKGLLSLTFHHLLGVLNFHLKLRVVPRKKDLPIGKSKNEDIVVALAGLYSKKTSLHLKIL